MMPPRRYRWRAGSMLAALSCIAVACALAQEPTKEAATKARIETLKGQIAEIRTRMRAREGERDTLQGRLRETEVEIGNLDRSLAEIEATIAAELPKLEALEVRRLALSAEVESAQATLSNEIQQLWSLQQGGGARVLFGDQHPDTLARNLAFYRRLLGARKEAVDAFQALLDTVARNQRAIAASQLRLNEQRTQLEAKRVRADALQIDRRTTLARIEAALSADGARVEELQADANRLTALLEELRQALAELETPDSYKAFTKAKGEMNYPISGRPSNRFGGRRNAANMRWRGWMMPAREGSPVTSIHHGRVVYADWLRGQGLLLIIDHGEGYLSLYGHNRSLQQEVGDWVAPGTVVATVGASGGAEQTALYFEIRHNGKPVDPGGWLRRK